MYKRQIQITDVLGYLIPDIKSGEPLYQIAGTDVYLVTIIIGSVPSLLLFALNMRGLAAAATVQKVLCFILVDVYKRQPLLCPIFTS